jgi:hypothetical protein
VIEYKASLAITPVRSKAVKQLIDIGLIPAECTRFELILDAKEAIRAKCEFFVSEDALQKIADALASNPEEVTQIIKTATVRPGLNEDQRTNPGLERLFREIEL